MIAGKKLQNKLIKFLDVKNLIFKIVYKFISKKN